MLTSFSSTRISQTTTTPALRQLWEDTPLNCALVLRWSGISVSCRRYFCKAVFKKKITIIWRCTGTWFCSMIIFFSVIIDQLVCKSKANPLQLIRPHHLEDSLSTAQRFPPPQRKKTSATGNERGKERWKEWSRCRGAGCLWQERGEGQVKWQRSYMCVMSSLVRCTESFVSVWCLHVGPNGL